MNIKTLVLGPLQTNCYILEKNNNYLIIDPADNPKEIEKHIKGKLEGILITHYHFDHINALPELIKKYNPQIYDYKTKEENIKLKEFNFKIIPLKGHKEDLVGFLFKDKLFSGDFIFENTIGRTDLPGGNYKEMQKSILKILNYQNLEIYPGHNNKTTLQKERDNLISYLWIRMIINNFLIKLNKIKINKQN